MHERDGGLHGLGLKRAGVAFAVGVVLACADVSRAPHATLLEPSAPLCQLGCVETDPSPEAPGVFLGSGVSPDACLLGGYTDVDQDGLGDFCEKQIALAFAPELAYYHVDNVGREPRWAAGPGPLGEEQVRVIYLLSYYVDLGPDTQWCDNNIVDLFDRSACHGHAGDSELIVLDLYYDSSIQHWVLQQASYSVHTGINVYPRGTATYPFALEYPDHAGAFPRAYVAYQKHANYASDDECDAGAFLNTDECYPDSFERVAAGNNLNIGTRAVHTTQQDCMPSANPFYADNGVIECYWTNRRFSGWQGFEPDADPYESKLAHFGF